MDWLEAHWLLTPGRPPLAGGRVALDKAEGRITEVCGGALALPETGTTWLTPGLINAHTHLELWAEAPIPRLPEETMADWILKVIAYTRALSEADRRRACQQSILELIRTGTTCVNDITTEGTSLGSLSQVGMRGIVSPEFFHPFPGETPDVSAIVARFRQLQTHYAQHPLLQVGLSPHSPYNVRPLAWEAAIQATQPALIHTHLAETAEEMAWFEAGASALDGVHQTILGKHFGPAQSGVTPVMAMAAVLNDRTVAAHGVFLSDEDITLLAQKGVTLAHCPRSNQWLSEQTMTRLADLQQAGVPVGLGTDSRLSCPDLDLRAEGRAAQHCHGLSAAEVFELMTQGSAQALHQDALLGHLAPGYAADLVLWWNPSEAADPYTGWLAPDTQPLLVLINGRIVLERDWEDL